MTAPKIKIGDKFNKLTVVERVENSPQGKAMWLVRCDCKDQNELILTSNRISAGRTKSCGCILRDRNVGKYSSTKSPLYRRWAMIIQRCKNESTTNYEYYGGRGITVYEPWVKSFIAFKDYIEKLHPDYLDLISQKYQVDRIDTDGNYEPGNIRLVTASDNSKNRRPKQGRTKNRYKPVIGSKTMHELYGQVFGELTVIEPTGESSSRGVLWKCICSCGNEKITAASFLTTGRVKSCGHLKLTPSNKSHGLREHPLYNYWARMKGRAKKGKIQITESWYDFTNFYSWAITQEWGGRKPLDVKTEGDIYGPDTCYFKPVPF